MARTTTDAVSSKVCPRCGGTGRYSFNLMDLDRCYGCGGVGRVPMTPRGQKKIKPTAQWRSDYAGRCGAAGDIVEINRTLYRIDRVIWHHYNDYDTHNQRVSATRLVDGKTAAFKRCAFGPDRTGRSWSITRDTAGNEIRRPARMNIDVTPAMEGQEATQDEAGEWVQFE